MMSEQIIDLRKPIHPIHYNTVSTRFNDSKDAAIKMNLLL